MYRKCERLAARAANATPLSYIMNFFSEKKPGCNPLSFKKSKFFFPEKSSKKIGTKFSREACGKNTQNFFLDKKIPQKWHLEKQERNTKREKYTFY